MSLNAPSDMIGDLSVAAAIRLKCSVSLLISVLARKSKMFGIPIPEQRSS